MAGWPCGRALGPRQALAPKLQILICFLTTRPQPDPCSWNLSLHCYILQIQLLRILTFLITHPWAGSSSEQAVGFGHRTLSIKREGSVLLPWTGLWSPFQIGSLSQLQPEAGGCLSGAVAASSLGGPHLGLGAEGSEVRGAGPLRIPHPDPELQVQIALQMSNGVRSQPGDSLTAGSGCPFPNPHLTRALLPVSLPGPLPQLTLEDLLTDVQEAIRKCAPHPAQQRA